MTTDGPIERFFESGDIAVNEPTILHHLRIDLVQLYGPEQIFEGSSTVPFLTASGILSGLDYISQIYFGKPGSHQTFITGISSLSGLSSKDLEVLYHFRCGLVHSASLYAASENRNNCQFPKHDFRITINEDPKQGNLFRSLNAAKEIVEADLNFWDLKFVFLNSIDKLKQLCQTDSSIANRVRQEAQKKIGVVTSAMISP